MFTTITIRLAPELKKRLDQLSIITRRSKSTLAVEAIRKFIELNEWQAQEIQSALKQADNGDIASNQEVKDAFSKWGVNYE